MKKIAVLTSGGDAPGMNAAIRAVVRTALAHNMETYGVLEGFAGLIAGEFTLLTSRDVGGIIQLGGTILGSARCPEFKTEIGQSKAIKNLHEVGIDGLVVIGGNGSQTGSFSLSQHNFPVVGIASTIDNDLEGSEITLGVDTALNIILESIDRLKTTASSHKRAFIMEVMGRDTGYLALMAGIAGGAEAILIPEQELPPEELAQIIVNAYAQGKKHALIIVAEGARHNAHDLETYFAQRKDELGLDLRSTILGHVQRGGAPTMFDRLLGSRFGVAAVESLIKGEHGVLIGLQKNQVTTHPLSQVVGKLKSPDLHLLELARTLASN